MNKPQPPIRYTTHAGPYKDLGHQASWESQCLARDELLAAIKDHRNPRVECRCTYDRTVMMVSLYDLEDPAYPAELKTYHAQMHQYHAHLQSQLQESAEALTRILTETPTPT